MRYDLKPQKNMPHISYLLIITSALREVASTMGLTFDRYGDST